MAKFILTEKQFKKIKTRINEQVNKVARTFDISNIFSSGQYVITDTSTIDSTLKEIYNIINEYKEYSINVIIVSSESNVPNRSAGFETGELSKNRLLKVNEYIKDKLPKDVKIIFNDMGPNGPEWDPSLGKDHPNYTKHQKVLLNVVINAKKITRILNVENNPEFCGKGMSGRGNYGDPNNYFIAEQREINIGPGVGQIGLIATPFIYPDLFIIQYNKKTYTTGLIGANSMYNRLIIGTILAHKRMDNPWFNTFQFNEYNVNNAKRIATQALKENNKAKDDVRHVFNEDMSPSLFDKYKPFILDDDIITHTNKQVVNFNKIEGQDSLKLTVIGIIGGTQWKMSFGCYRPNQDEKTSIRPKTN